jgi:hypothetical protein
MEKLCNDAKDEKEEKTYQYLDSSGLGKVNKNPIYEESYEQYVYYVPERYLRKGF